MDSTNVPSRLNVRLGAAERQAVATVATAIATPYRRTPNVAETMRAALHLAAEAVRARDTSAAAE